MLKDETSKMYSLEPDLNQWPMDLYHSNYSPPLYQLSYRGIMTSAIFTMKFEYVQLIAVLDINDSPAGNWTRVSRVTGGDTHHYTTKDSAIDSLKKSSFYVKFASGYEP